jgi:epoxyqueuosine reductase
VAPVSGPQKPPRPRLALAKALARGDLADQHYLGRSLAWRGDPSRLLRDGQSFVSQLFRYRCEEEEENPEKGVIARYARGSDYHQQLKAAMFALAEELRAKHGKSLRLRAVTDSAPVHERHLAWTQGGGWFGRQSSIIHPNYGAASLIAELVVDRPIESSHVEPHEDRCGSCRACVQVCPTQAIAADGYRVDSRRCISYWTIEHRGIIPRWIMERMGQRIFGCDDCTVICPWNSKAKAKVLPGLEPRSENLAPNLLGLLEYRDPDAFALRFAESPVLRPGVVGFMRNVVVALASLESEASRSACQRIMRDDNSPVLRATAVWSLHRLGGDIDSALLDDVPAVVQMARELLEGEAASPPSPLDQSWIL